MDIRNGKLDSKWSSRKTAKSINEKSRTALDGKFDTKTQGSHACLKPVYSMYFCQGMVLLNPVCILLSGMLHIYKSEVRVAVFET